MRLVGREAGKGYGPWEGHKGQNGDLGFCCDGMEQVSGGRDVTRKSSSCSCRQLCSFSTIPMCLLRVVWSR